MNEKRERFVRVAEGRTNKIIEMLRLLGNCSNKSNYEYDEKDIIDEAITVCDMCLVAEEGETYEV